MFKGGSHLSPISNLFLFKLFLLVSAPRPLQSYAFITKQEDMDGNGLTCDSLCQWFIHTKPYFTENQLIAGSFLGPRCPHFQKVLCGHWRHKRSYPVANPECYKTNIPGKVVSFLMLLGCAKLKNKTNEVVSEYLITL